MTPFAAGLAGAIAWCVLAAAWLWLGPRWLGRPRIEAAPRVQAWAAFALAVTLGVPLVLVLARMLAWDGLAPLVRSRAAPVAGALVLAAGLAWMLYVGRYLAVRLYALPLERRPLLTGGPFALVRHPFFLHFPVVIAGLTLLFVHPLPLVMLATYPELEGPRTLRAQMRAEEEAMRARFGAEYERYAARTRRLVPLRRSHP